MRFERCLGKAHRGGKTMPTDEGGCVLKPSWKIVIVAVLLAALITLASLFYFWWISSVVSDGRTPSAALTKTNVTDGVRFNFVSLTMEMTWGQVRIYVSDGLRVNHWEPSDRDFAGYYSNVTVVLKNMTLGERIIGCEIYDQGLVGRIGNGDQFTLYGSPGTYMMSLVYEPTHGVMVQDSFFLWP
jgi:hypothetical protein